MTIGNVLWENEVASCLRKRERLRRVENSATFFYMKFYCITEHLPTTNCNVLVTHAFEILSLIFFVRLFLCCGVRDTRMREKYLAEEVNMKWGTKMYFLLCDESKGGKLSWRELLSVTFLLWCEHELYRCRYANEFLIRQVGKRKILPQVIENYEQKSFKVKSFLFFLSKRKIF
jgi:hypothetical protein